MIDILKKLWESAKPFAVNFVFRWVMKVGGGAIIAYSGWGEQDVLLFVGGILSIVVGIIFSLVQNKKAVYTPSPTQPVQ